jgi:flavin-dependent thymidylate synthase
MNIEVELQEYMGSDRSIAESAWTSSFDRQKKNTRTEEDVVRIINMLADSGHSVPFESVIFKFWISLPIQTDRQHMTHRIMSHSGLSGRYRTMPNKWLSVPDDIFEIADKVGDISIEKEYSDLCATANDWYRDKVELFRSYEKIGTITNGEFKRLREFFRGVLPLNNMTERVTVTNLRSFANYYKLRSSPHAQPEIQKIANLMLSKIKNRNICPAAIEALSRNNWVI